MSQQPTYIDPQTIHAKQARLVQLQDEAVILKRRADEFEKLSTAAASLADLPNREAALRKEIEELTEASTQYKLFVLGQPEVSLAVNPATPDNVLTHRISVTFRSPVNGEPKVLALSDIAQGSIEELALFRAEALPACVARLADTPTDAMIRYRRGRANGYLPARGGV